MKRHVTLLRMLLWAMFVVSLAETHSQADNRFHTNPACWNGPRIYHEGPPTDELASRIRLVHEPPGAMPEEAVVSPNGGYRFWVQTPDTSQPGPWKAALFIDAEGDTWPTLLVEEVAGPIQPRWINEKLIFVRVVWGRIAFSDLILDVEKGELVYHEQARDGQIVYQQFQQGCEGKCPCNSAGLSQ